MVPDNYHFKMYILTGTLHHYHSIDVSSENKKRVDIPIQKLLEENYTINFISTTMTPKLTFKWKYIRKNKCCPTCTLMSNEKYCPMCNTSLNTYYSYVSSVIGDTTYISENSEIAVINTINVIEAGIDRLVSKNENIFLIIRPPGHHCYDTGDNDTNTCNGFCLINNIIYGIKYLQTMKPLSKITIIDWDAHRANGTQSQVIKMNNVILFDMFEEKIFPYDENVKDDKIIQYPMSKHMNKEDYKSIFDKIISEIIKISPDYIFISCGFDAHKDDNMSNLNFDNDLYAYFSKKLNNIGLPTIYFLEGGYVPDIVYSNIKSIIDINTK